MKSLKKFLQVTVLIALFHNSASSQTCITSSITAGSNTTICTGQCATLTASVNVINSSTSYSVGSTPYLPQSFSGGVPAIGNIDDVWGNVINIGFDFCFFGNTFNQLVIGSNGEITFNTAVANGAESFAVNNVLPNLTEHQPNSICGAYRDIDPSVGIGSTVTYYTTGVAPCRQFVANWNNVPLYSCNNPTSTFQVILYEKTNIIDVFIQNSSACMAWQNGRGLIGIQNGTGTTAVSPPGRNVLTPWTSVNEAWRFTPTGAPTYTVNWTGPNGFSSTGLTATPCPTATSTYTATLNEVNCAGTINSFTSAVQVSVTPIPTIALSASPSSICTGSSSTLTATGATSYTWMPGNLIGSSITVSPVSSTIYTVTALSGLCTTTRTIGVNVIASPTLSAFATPTLICPGNSSTLTASGAASYTWSPGGLSGSSVVVSPAVSTIYTVTGANAAGCTNTTTTSVNISNPAIIASSNPATLCIGNTATLTANGAASYTWNPGNTTGATTTVSPSATTLYTVVGTTTLGCTASQTLNLTVASNPTVTAVVAPTVICAGSPATLTASGAASYTWNPGAVTGSTRVVNPAVTTTYTVIGRTGSCSGTNTVVLTVNPSPTVTASASPTIICIGDASTLTANGASTYTWNPGNLSGTSITVTPAASTIYTVTGTDAMGCNASRTVNVVVSPNTSVTATASSNTICAGQSTTLTGSGATSFSWDPGALTGSTIVVSPLANTIYTVIGSNAAGCNSTYTISIGVSPNPTITASASSTTVCAGNSASLTANGASTYTWNPGNLAGSTVTVSPTASTIYSVTGTSVFGCSDSQTIAVNVIANPTITASSNPTLLCIGNSATLTANGGTSYTWSPGGITSPSVVVSPTITSSYSVTGSNAFGCVATASVNLKVSPKPTINATASPTSICSGASSTLTGTGATSYTWTPGNANSPTTVVSPTTSTNYTLTGIDPVGCTSTNTVNVVVSPSPTLTASSTNTLICSGSSVVLSASGATSYTWNPGNVSSPIAIVSPTATTIYTVTGSNTGSCSSTATIQINVNPTPTVVAVSNPTILCSGGSATLTANGAVNYLWNPGAVIGSTIVVTPTISTTYTVTGVTGACSNSVSLNLVVGTNPTVSATASSNTVCAGSSSTLSANGATTYTWNPGMITGASITVNPTVTTTYTVDGSNGSGCIQSQTITITVNALPSLSISASPSTICANNSSTLSAAGALSYTWNPGTATGNSLTVTPSVSTVYSVTGNDGTCATTETITVSVIGNPTISISASSNSICAGAGATLTATGASAYTWSPGGFNGANLSVNPAITTTYSVTGSNAICSSTQTISLVVTSNPSLTITASSNTICAGNQATLTASGASSFTWNPGALSGANVTVTPVSSTIYTLTGDNGSGCVSTETIAINVSSAPSISIAASSTVLCAGGTVTLTASGATSFTWMPVAITSPTISDSPPMSTTYSVNGADALGCTGTQTISVNVMTPSVSIVSTATAICTGSSATLTGTGASSYTWNPGGDTGNNTVVTPTTTTTYTLTGAVGSCLGTQTITLIVSPLPTLTVSASTNTICAGSTVTLTASGASSYTWNPGGIVGTSITDAPSITTNYTVTADNGSGCITNETITINVNSAPSISITATPTTLCAAGTVTLTASGATSYTWNPSTVTTPSLVDTPSLTTTYSVTGTDPVGCSSSQTLTVNVGLPVITLSGSSPGICVGNSATLTASGAVSYTWNPGSLTGPTTVVSPTSTTTYTVDGGNGSCIGTQTITLIVSASPTLIASASSNTVCAGSSVTLTASGAASYTWNPGALTGSNVVVNPNSTTSYTVDGDNGSGCIASETITINVNTLPVVSIAATPSVLCSSGSVTLTASGASTYTWNPSLSTGPTLIDVPVVTTTYSVTGSDGLGCIDTQTITISVGNPTITVAAISNTICAGTTATLTASGATTYTWFPAGVSGSSFTDLPTTTTTYTVTGDNGGCVSTNTFVLTVNNSPTITANASPTVICSGFSTTLTANGSTTYTWNPVNLSGASIVTTPTISTVYTVSAEEAGCTATATVLVNVSPSPENVTALSNGTLSCSSPTVSLSGSSTSTNVIYTWAGPNTYTSSTQNPIDITAPGDYTLTVTDPLSGCNSSATTAVTGNTLLAVVSANVSGMLGCNSTVTLTAAGMGTASYNWTGPLSFTSSVQSPTTNVPGDYTVTVVESPSGCTGTATVTVMSNSVAPSFTATILPATCTGTVANNDGSISLSGFGITDTYDLVQASTYTGSATYLSASTVPGSGIITTTLNNPLTPTPYTIRLFGSNGCFSDITVFLIPASCAPPVTVLGLTKAAGTPTLINNDAYHVTYTIVATNTSSVDLSSFSIFDNLNATFPLPTTYSIISTPSITSMNSSLTANPAFNGSTQTDILISSSSTLTAGRKDTIVFTVQVDPNGYFGPFLNSAIGFGTDNGVVVSDSSNTGFSWDPDNDGDPTNNDVPTVVYLAPNTNIAVAKTGTASGVMLDKTLDVTYTILVKNTGNDTIKFVQVLDTINIPSPANFNIKSGPVTTGILIANSNYNGSSDVGLLIASTSELAPGESETITFVINITPNGISSVTNIAIAAGFGADGGIVRDSSNNGTNPDPNGNGIGTEVGENIPTVVELPDVNLFIPEVFTPDGDGKNDYFVIKGIEGRTVKLTVFNRWGNTVYENEAYNNTWDGLPNVGGLIIGNSKLPQGTYYYIVEFEDQIDKPVNGFVVLQY
ncbi:MAG: hypothetical protein K0R26_207 [Bacteroidota bacterium]|nr:hypothetical protein [Bacteroidota bacterium]